MLVEACTIFLNSSHMVYYDCELVKLTIVSKIIVAVFKQQFILLFFHDDSVKPQKEGICVQATIYIIITPTPTWPNASGCCTKKLNV